MEVNVKKCKSMEFSKGKMRPRWNYKIGCDQITTAQEEKVLGLIFQKDLSS